MGHKFSALFLSGALFFTSCSSSVEGTKPSSEPSQPAQEILPEVKTLVEGNNTFALDLYAKLKEYPDNVFYSPYSISTALGMTYLGAKGKTHEQMAQVLHFTQDEDALNQAFSFLNMSLAEGMQVKTANSLWLQTGEKFLPSFQASIAKGYSASLQQVDFMRRPEEARFAINRWVSHFTFGKISDLLQPGDVDANTRLVLVNAIYMKAPWESPFSQRDSKISSFHTTATSKSNVVLMEKTGTFPYYKGEGFSAIELPYERGKNPESQLAMVIFLPDEIEGLPQFEKTLSIDNFNQWLDDFKMTYIQLFLPKFKLTQSLQLAKILEEMGMTLAFGKEADFSEMTSNPSLAIGKVIHEAFLKVDEYGTEAAAATAVNMKVLAIYHPEPPVVFRADHPFFFAIIEKNTRAILFVGSTRQVAP